MSGRGSAPAAGKLSFARDVYDAVIRARCAACHSDAPSFGGLALFPGASTAYANLVGVPAGAAEDHLCRASGLLRVQAGEPERSLIYLKLTRPSCGGLMPPAVLPSATPAQIELVRQWTRTAQRPNASVTQYLRPVVASSARRLARATHTRRTPRLGGEP
jgi:hypothetical protein